MPLNPSKPNPVYLIYMHKEDLALNNQQWLICHKTKLNHFPLLGKGFRKKQKKLNKINKGNFGLVSLFNGISTFVGYLMPKPSL